MEKEFLNDLGKLYSNIINIVGERINGTVVQITDNVLFIMIEGRIQFDKIKDLDIFIGTRGLIEARNDMLVLSYSLD